MNIAGAVTLTKQQWDEMSDKDRAVLHAIGINPTFKEPKQKTPKVTNPVTKQHILENRNTAPAEYYVKNRIHCTCCSGEEVVEGKMVKPDPRNNFLAFVKEKHAAGQIHRVRRLERINCPQCRARLMQLDKEMLVGLVMMLVDKNAKREDTGH